MATISSSTSIMDFLGNSSSSLFFGELEEQTELTKEQLERQKRVEDELTSMNDAVQSFQTNIVKTFDSAVKGIKDGITNPINALKADSISAYTSFTESIYDMRDTVSNKLTDTKDIFKSSVDSLQSKLSSSVEGLKVGFTDAVTATNSMLDNMSVKMEAFSNLPTEKQILLAGQTIADGVMGTISAIPDVLSVGMEKLNKGISSVSSFAKTSSSYLKGLFQNAEEGEDVGTTSGLKAQTEKKEEEGGGIGGMLGKIPKGLKSGLGKLGKLAGKLALPLAVLTAGMSFVDGIQNASEIVGKSADKLSSVEKVGAGLASVVSDLTFGLVSAESIYSEGKQVIDGISGFASDMYAKLPDGVKQYTDKIGEFLFGSEGGVFSSIGDLFNSTVEAIANGDWGTVALNSILGPLKAVFGADGMLANTAKGIFNLLPSSFQESITDFAGTIMGWFDTIKNMASDLIPDSLKKLFGMGADSGVGKAISGGIDSAKSYFGFGGKEELKPDTKAIKGIPTIASKAPATTSDGRSSVVTEYGGGNPILEAQLAKNRAIIAEKYKKQKTESIANVSEEKIEGTASDNPELAQKIKERKQRLQDFIKSRQARGKSGGIEISEAVKNVKDSDTATKKSKERMDSKQQTQPVIINTPAPAQKASGGGKQLNTGTSIGDTELAVMNSNMMD